MELEPYLIPEITPLESPFTYPKCVILGEEPSSSSWLEPLTETQTQELPPIIWKHKHTHTLLHLLLTNSSDNIAEFSINLIIHSDYALVKTKTFLSSLLSHIFLQKKILSETIMTC